MENEEIRTELVKMNNKVSISLKHKCKMLFYS
jgi:hypothetical protein